MHIYHLVAVISCLLFCNSALSQTKRADSIRQVLLSPQDDTTRIKTLHQLTGALMNNAQDSALIHAREAFQLSKDQQDPYFLGQSIMNITHAYFVNGLLDSAKLTLKNAIPFYTKHEKYFWLSASYRNLAVLGEVEEQPDTSLYYLDRCIQVLDEHPDSIVLGDVYLSKGFAYRTKGHYQLSIESLLNALRIFEDIGNVDRKGYVSQNLGLTLYQSGRIAEGLQRNLASVDYFLQVDNIRAAAQSMNNVGVYSFEQGKIEEAVEAHKKSIEWSEQTNQNDVLLDNYLNLADIYCDMNVIDSCNFWVRKADELSKSMSYVPGMCEVAVMNSRIALFRQNIRRALNDANTASENVETILDPQKRQIIYEDLSEIYEELDRANESLFMWKKARYIQDSLFTLRQDQQVEELNLIYQTEKKDKEIELLNKNAVIASVKRQRLWGGLVLLAFSALAMLFGLNQRSKKKQALLSKEKALETQKRIQAEEQLESKKKELTAKALQLARKNEFLQSLEEEVIQLKSSVDQTVNKTSQRISRMIHNDALDEDEWSQFAKEFSSVHQDFISKLSERYGTFSQSEMRLASLLKMNLTSKDIANILRISDEGIKKARYRLRKKMGLKSGEDLQGILIAL